MKNWIFKEKQPECCSILTVLLLLHVFKLGTFECVRVEKLVKRNPQSVTDELNGDDAGIVAAPVDDVLQRRGRDARLPRKRVDVIAMLRAQLLNTERNR